MQRGLRGFAGVGLYCQCNVSGLDSVVVAAALLSRLIVWVSRIELFPRNGDNLHFLRRVRLLLLLLMYRGCRTGNTLIVLLIQIKLATAVHVSELIFRKVVQGELTTGHVVVTIVIVVIAVCFRDDVQLLHRVGVAVLRWTFSRLFVVC